MTQTDATPAGAPAPDAPVRPNAAVRPSAAPTTAAYGSPDGASDGRAERYDAPAIQERWLPVWDELAPFRSGRPDDPRPQQVRARHVPVPLRRPAHGSRRGVRARRRRRAVLGAARLQRHAPHRLGRLRPARRERRHQARPGPARLDLRQHRAAEGVDAALRVLLRLGPRAADVRPGVLQLEPVAVPALLRAGPGLPQAEPGQLVPERPDGAGQRAGRRRPLRALRHARSRRRS